MPQTEQKKAKSGLRKVKMIKPGIRALNPRLNAYYNRPGNQFVPKNIDIVDKERRGTLNVKLRQNLRQLSKEQQTIAMSILNPGHAANTPNAIGISSPGSGRVFISKSVFQFDFQVPVNTTDISFFNTPFFEYPVGFFCNSIPYLVPNPNYAKAVGGATDLVENYLRDHNVYAVTPIGISTTIDQITTQLDLKGTVTTARKPHDCDMTDVATVNAGLVPTATLNTKTLQDIPVSLNQITRLNGTVDVRKSSEGAYLVSHHQDMNPVKRDMPWNKGATFANIIAAGDPCGRAYIRTVDGNSYNFRGYYSDTDLRTYVSPSMILPLDMPIAYFSGFKNSEAGMVSFRVKVATSYQFDLKLTSDLYPYTVDRPIADAEFMQYIWAFEGLMTAGGFPASWNFLDKLWPIFKQIWQGGGGDLARRIPKAGKVIGDVGDLITNLF